MSERIEDRASGYVAIRRSGKDKLSNHIKLAEDNWSIGSKKKLKVSTRHKMKKIFVGILYELDKEKSSGNIDEDTFKRLRSRILNLGNEQVRNMEIELDERYNVEALNYHIEFKVVGPNGLDGKDG
ncbi:hypothetical protein E4G67_00185 [Candidatus Bathyarchaeota archaeon]|nr:MAG: hypothetical protein E4G67_00185 [Candidatus Bathyarchaeota archaeon]